MQGFSVASLTSTCSTISHRALSTAVEIDELQKAVSPSGGDASSSGLERLVFLGTKLLQFRQHTDILQECLSSAATISPRLQAIVVRSLRQCDSASAVLEKQVKRLHPQDLDGVRLETVAVFEDLLVRYSRLFIFATQLLSMPSASSQDSKLDHSDGQALVDAAEASAQTILSGIDILTGHTGQPLTNGISTPGPTAGTSPPAIPAAVPPPFPDVEPDDDPSAKTTMGPLAKGFSSLTNSLKAMTAAMRPKPEPFVSALCQAAAQGHTREIKGLLEQGANINGRNEDGNTALICAINSKQSQNAIFLIESGADNSVKSSSGKRRPPLYHALDVGDLETAQYLLDHGATVNEKNMYGQNHFVDVVHGEKLDLIALLLRYGADVHAREVTGRPVIAHAVQRANMDLARLLLAHGADANARDISGQPLLATAASKNRADLVQLLLASGASPNARTNTGASVLVDAVQRSRTDIAKLLLASGANPNVNDLMGTSLLLTTVRSATLPAPDKDSLVRLLLAHGASPNVTDSWGLTGLAHAAAADNVDTVRLFLGHGADPNQPVHGDSLLINAIDKGRLEQARLLVDHGANPNKTDKLGRTPLLVAMQKQDADMVRLLIERGADVNMTGSVTPGGFARVWGDGGVLRALRERGAVGVGEEGGTPPVSRRTTRVTGEETGRTGRVQPASGPAAGKGEGLAGGNGEGLGGRDGPEDPPPEYHD